MCKNLDINTITCTVVSFEIFKYKRAELVFFSFFSFFLCLKLIKCLSADCLRFVWAGKDILLNRDVKFHIIPRLFFFFFTYKK